MPSHLQMESGFSDQSSLTGSENSGSASKCSAAEEQLQLAKKAREDVRETLQSVRDYLSAKNKPAESMDHYLCQVADYSQMMKNENVLDTMSPESKKVYLDSLKKQRKSILEKLNNTTSD
jgi:hypothetical protein